MDLTTYAIEELLASAIKSEVEAGNVYKNLAENVKNSFLKDRLMFLSGEEVNHRRYLEKLWHKRFPGVGIALPEDSKVPLPAILVWDESMPVSDVLISAMEAEKAAADFYNSLAERFDEKEPRNMLKYLSRMEMGHYRILDEELRNLEVFEDYDTMWPLMHAGP